MIRNFGIFLLLMLALSACSSDNGDTGEPVTDSFDRSAMLANWADNIIVPAFENFTSSTQELEAKTKIFAETPSMVNLATLRIAFENAYLDFQTVSMFEIGKAEELNYRNFLNTYPAAITAMEEKINSGNISLALPSTYSQQGFPALDYLINGVAETDAEIVAVYSSEKYKNYLKAVSERINALTKEVNTSWQGAYRNTFVSNTSSSSTGSVDKFTNHFVMYYEKFLRSGKIGYPAGAFTGEPLPQNVEAFYSDDLSRKLYIKALESVRDFFNGKHFSGSQTGPSYRQYLDHLSFTKAGEKLSNLINSQFTSIISQASQLDPNLKLQVESNNEKMLKAFDELQKAVVLLKVDMLQALSISVNYVDSDGD